MSDNKMSGSDLTEAALFFTSIRARKAGNSGDQAARQPARSCAGLFARRRRALPRHCRRPGQGGALHARGNLVGVISNGTAVLGLGNIGPLASKPVMEGKAVLFKKFAGIDVFDIEIDANRRIRWFVVGGAGADLRRHQPGRHQGAGVLRDRGAAAREDEHPGLPRRPARHRDHRRRRRAQRLELAGKPSRGQDRHLGRRCRRARLPQHAGLARRETENIWVTDIEGVVYEGREKLMDRWKAALPRRPTSGP
jgi:malate dehydrogenase (oxaloacetate-decarboxylating)(NADP+)